MGRVGFSVPSFLCLLSRLSAGRDRRPSVRLMGRERTALPRSWHFPSLPFTARGRALALSAGRCLRSLGLMTLRCPEGLRTLFGKLQTAFSSALPSPWPQCPVGPRGLPAVSWPWWPPCTGRPWRRPPFPEVFLAWVRRPRSLVEFVSLMSVSSRAWGRVSGEERVRFGVRGNSILSLPE